MELLFRTQVEFTNKESFEFMSKSEKRVISEEVEKINNLIDTFNLFTEKLEIPQVKSVKKLIVAKREEIDVDIEFFINNMNTDIKRVMERVNKNVA